MYGTILKLGMKAAPHLAGYATLGGIGLGVTDLVNPDYVDQLYKKTVTADDLGDVKARGFGALVLSPFAGQGDKNADDLVNEKRNQLITSQLQTEGYTLQDLEGLSANPSLSEVQGAVVRKKRAVADAKDEKLYRRSMELPYLQMQQAREDRLADLQYQRMQLEREDKRYNERIDREERNRRQESIMALMGGLTSLGAAFAM